MSLQVAMLACGLAITFSVLAFIDGLDAADTIRPSAPQTERPRQVARPAVSTPADVLSFVYYVVSSREQASEVEAGLGRIAGQPADVQHEVIIADTPESERIVDLLQGHGVRELMQLGKFLNVVDLR